jgi:hypothetical protein
MNETMTTAFKKIGSRSFPGCTPPPSPDVAMDQDKPDPQSPRLVHYFHSI